jgi:hypothetical protein
MKTALFAQRAFQIGPETTGQFLMATRRGGIQGFDQPGAALERTIEDAMRLGLEGSELREFAEQQANTLLEFKRTGIVIDTKSVNAMAMTLAKVGLGGVQGARVAQGVATYGRQLAARGPRTGLDIQFLKHFGGVDMANGMGPGELEQALINVEQMKRGGDPQAIEGFMREIIKLGGGGDAGRLLLGDVLPRMGIPLSRELVREAGLEVEGGGMSASVRAKIQSELKEGGEAADAFREGGGIRGRAVGAAGDALRELAIQANRHLDAGEKLIGTYVNLKVVLGEAVTAVGTFGPALQDLTSVIKSISSSLLPGGYTAAPKGPQSQAESE